MIRMGAELQKPKINKKIKFPCPCGGKIHWAKEKVVQQGIDCGILDVEICGKCGEMYLPDWSMLEVEKKLKEKGLWGMERKEIKFWKSGKSIVMRLPTKLVHKFGLDNVKKGYVYKEGENRFVIEY